MPSIDSAHPLKVDGMHRNRWTTYSGFGGRLAPESVVAFDRITHSDISLTLNTYSHVLPSMQEEAAEKMDEIRVPIEVSATLKRVKEPSPSFAGTVQPQ